MTLSSSYLAYPPIGAAQQSATPPAAPAQASSAAAAANTFDIREFRVLGNHTLPVRRIEHAVYPFLGAARDIGTVKQAAAALEKAYKDAGYGTIYVDIPEQEVSDGIVRLQVTEGRLDRVHVRGERYFSGRQIRAALPALQPGQTPDLPALQQQLGALNAVTPDRVVTPILKAGPEPGTVDVDLAVKDTLPLHGSVQYDDRHVAGTTPNRATAALSYDNLWQRQDSFSVQYQTAPANPANAEVLSTSYLAHLGDSFAALSFIHTSSNELAVGTLGVLGQGSIYGAHWVRPLASTPSASSSFDAGVDYKDVLTQVLPNASGSAGAAAITAPVKYLNWSATYSQAWRATNRSFGFSAGADFGIRSLINSTDQFENSRYNATPGYLYLRLSANANQSLPAGFGLLERLSGQWTPDALVNNEQFSLGGLDTVRGYYEAEVLGDSGAAGTLELHSPRLGPRLGTSLSPLYGFVFADAGVATLVDALRSQIAQATLWSSGVGLRLENATGPMGTLDFAIPGRDGTQTKKNHARVDFVVRYGF